jgi:3-hydroxyisobutyrate dehydrogenase-like beta-hydroxyacid dehydrogenase
MSDRREQVGTGVAPIGFIGLGDIGLPMATRLLRCGVPLVVYNRTRSKAEQLAEHGALAVDAPADVARRVEAVITCLHDSAADDAVYRGPDGLLHADVTGKLFVNTATIGPAAAIELAADLERSGAEYVDGALMGRGVADALAGTLLLPVGGRPAVIERARPLLSVLANRIEHLGPIGTAQVLKLVNNLQVGIHSVALAEAVRIALAAGADQDALARILPQGSSRCRAMDLFLVPMLSGERRNSGSLKTLGKDIDLAVAFAEAVGEPSDLGAAAARRFHRAIGSGDEHLDVSVLVDLITKR